MRFRRHSANHLAYRRTYHRPGIKEDATQKEDTFETRLNHAQTLLVGQNHIPPGSVTRYRERDFSIALSAFALDRCSLRGLSNRNPLDSLFSPAWRI